MINSLDIYFRSKNYDLLKTPIDYLLSIPSTPENSFSRLIACYFATSINLPGYPHIDIQAFRLLYTAAGYKNMIDRLPKKQ